MFAGVSRSAVSDGSPARRSVPNRHLSRLCQPGQSQKVSQLCVSGAVPYCTDVMAS